MRVRTILAGVAGAAAVALVAAGCGSSSVAGSTSLGGAASIAPSNAVAFVAVDSDVSSGQWSEVDSLLGKFPAHDQLLANLRKSFEQKTKLSWADDVKPALGSELDLIALPGKQPQLVGLTQGGDKAKLDALLPKLDKNAVSMQIDGWTAFASTQKALDAVSSATTKLSDNNTYQSAIAKLAGDALVRAYANGTEAQQLLASLGSQTPSVSTPPFAWASADLVASGDGLRLNGYSHDASQQGVVPRLQTTPPTPYASALVDEIPAGALLVADFPITPGEFQYSDTSKLPKSLQAFLRTAPTFLAELDNVFGGETALYVRPGLPIPEITIVTQPNDTQEAEQTLADVLKTLRQAGGSVGGINLANVPIVHAAVGGQLIISTSQQGIADFRSAGAKLSSDPSFTAAQKAASMPAQTTGFLYVNLATALPIVQAVAPLLGLKLPPVVATTDLGALKTLTAYGTRSGDDAGFTALVEIH
jgi:Protein of unknown function (DUF3352)